MIGNLLSGDMMRRTKEQKLFYYKQQGLYERKIQQLEECEERVCWLLHRFPHYRDCDKCLIFGYWHLVDGFGKAMSSEAIHNLTPAESITRARRAIQNDCGLFLPNDPEILVVRGINQEAVRKWATM